MGLWQTRVYNKARKELMHRSFEEIRQRVTVTDPLAVEDFIMGQSVGLIGTLFFMISEAHKDFLEPELGLKLAPVGDEMWLLFVIQTGERWDRARQAERQFEKETYKTRGNIDQWQLMYDVQMIIDI